ncbi:MAG: hypothetical protein LE169_04360 [Endomicrobium sp.]|nr:hypothetical protein [Endomicrobium sp.]
MAPFLVLPSGLVSVSAEVQKRKHFETVVQEREHLRTVDAELTLSAVLLQSDIRTAVKNSEITFFFFLYNISDVEIKFKKGAED